MVMRSNTYRKYSGLTERESRKPAPAALNPEEGNDEPNYVSQANNWGIENTAHAKLLDDSHMKNILKKHDTYTSRKEGANHIRTWFSLTFEELYRDEQIRYGLCGPILIYQMKCSILFLKGCSDHRIYKTLSLGSFLDYAGKPLDYCFHLAEMANFIPSYQGETRAFTFIQDFPKNTISSHQSSIVSNYPAPTMQNR